ncbi:MAG: hypothetical protein ABSF99_02825 [Anaerolineales bacterium]|jgi:predicted RNA-binding Zn-ribbon protein involved in translation (DUF1610 family)
MDTALIPAVCPNCGGNLQVDPGTDTVICQYCGTEHIIRRDTNGSVTLEAFARCPLCKRNDRSEKVSAIIKSQTGQSESVVQQQRVYTDSKGHAHLQTVNVPVKTVQTSDLARRLAPPPSPLIPSKVRSTRSLLIISIISMVLGIVGIVLASTNSSDYAVCGVSGVILIPVAIVLFLVWVIPRKKRQEKAMQQQASLNNAYQQWKQATSRWEKLYYCERDDIVFIPGEKTNAPVTNMLDYINSNNA